MKLAFVIFTGWFAATWGYSIYQGELNYLHPFNLVMLLGLLTAVLFAFWSSRVARYVSSAGAILFSGLSVIQAVVLLFAFSSSEGASMRVTLFDRAFEGLLAYVLFFAPPLAYGTISALRIARTKNEK